MYQGHQIGAVLLMGGSGLRFGGGLPKQFRLLEGKPLYRHTLDLLLSLEIFDEIILVCHAAWMERIPSSLASNVRLAVGRPTRQGSSLAGLKAFSSPPEIVLVHDAVRPFLTGEIVLANTCIRSADTLVHAPSGQWIGSIPNRDEFFRGQTPQTFRYRLLLEAHEAALRAGIENASDDCRLILALGAKVAVVEGAESNLKITSEWDLKLAEALVAIRNEKIEESQRNDGGADKERRVDVPAGERTRDEWRDDLSDRPHRP